MTRLTTQPTIGVCPACRKDITGTATYEMETFRPEPVAENTPASAAPSGLHATFALRGMQVQHSCGEGSSGLPTYPPGVRQVRSGDPGSVTFNGNLQRVDDGGAVL